MSNSIVRKCDIQDLRDYLDSVKNNQNQILSFNDFIKNKYFNKDSNKIVIANLVNQEISEDLTNANLQGVILEDTTFNSCNFTDTILCDTDLNNVIFNECKFINTDFRGANLHYTDFNYKDFDESLQINDLVEKINGIKVSFSNIEKLNKYIDKDLEKEKELSPLLALKNKELHEKQEALETLQRNLRNPGVLANFLNTWWNSYETIEKNKQNTQVQIAEIQKEVNTLETETYTLDNLRMFCGNNLETIFKQLEEEKIAVETDPSYIIGSTEIERNTPKKYVKLTLEDFNLYLAEAAKNTITKLSLIKFIRKQANLSEDLRIIPDLSGIDLSNKSLKHLDLRNTIFADANLENIKISNCNLNYANFEGANLQNANFQNITANNTGFLFANLKGSKIKGSDMSRCYMPKVDLSESEIIDSSFKAAIMFNADAQKINIKDSKWNNANLTGISFAYADMQRVKMRGATLTNGLLSEARIIASDFENAFMDKVRAVGAKFQGQCNLKHITARNAYFNDAEFDNVLSLEKADLREAIMQRVKLVNANMTNALLDKANLEYADLTGAILNEVSAKFSNLSNAVLNNANAEGIDLSDAVAKNISAQEANFKNAIMQRADITKSDFTKAIFKNADMQCLEAADAIFKKAILCRANLKGANLGGIKKENTDFDQAKMDDATQLHSTEDIAQGKVEYYDKKGNKISQDINDLSDLKDKIHAREKSGWFLKTGAGQLCAKFATNATLELAKFTNLLASKKVLIGVALLVGVTVAVAPFIAFPVLAVAGVGVGVQIAIAIAAISAGSASAVGIYKITQRPLRRLSAAFKSASSGINKYISPLPADIDEKARDAQQARQDNINKNAKIKEENLNEVNDNIAKSKDDDIFKKHQAKVNSKAFGIEKETIKAKVKDIVDDLHSIKGKVKTGAQKLFAHKGRQMG